MYERGEFDNHDSIQGASAGHALGCRGFRRSLKYSQMQFGAPMPNSFAALLKLKFANPTDLRDTLLAKRWTQSELLERKLIDEIAPPDQLMSKAVELAKREGSKVGSGVWGQIKVR